MEVNRTVQYNRKIEDLMKIPTESGWGTKLEIILEDKVATGFISAYENDKIYMNSFSADEEPFGFVNIKDYSFYKITKKREFLPDKIKYISPVLGFRIIDLPN